MTDVVILDYGSGNLRSAQKALETTGVSVTVTSDFETALNADGLVVPGVGAFSACMAGFNSVRGAQIIERRLAGGKAVLGICVGMQILFDSSTEHQDTDVEQTNWNGISQWPGVVEKLQAQVLPHMGWNTVTSPEQSKMFAGIEHERFYFLHTYAATKWILNPEGAFRAPLVTWTNYEQDFVSAVENGPLWATQFHPEKSGPAGLRLLQNWVDTL